MKFNRIYLWTILVCMFNQVNADLPTINEEIKLIEQDVECFKKDWQKLYDQKKEKFRWPAVIFACMGAAALFGVVTGLVYGDKIDVGTSKWFGRVYGAIGGGIFGAGAYGGYHYFTRPRTEERCICKYYKDFEQCFQKINDAKIKMESVLKKQDGTTPENLKLYCEMNEIWEKHLKKLSQCLPQLKAVNNEKKRNNGVDADLHTFAGNESTE